MTDTKLDPAVPSEMPEAVRPYTASQIREWIRARGYLTIEQHNMFGDLLPTSNMGHCMESLADALEEIEVLRSQPAPALRMTEELERVIDAASARALWHLDNTQRGTFNAICDDVAAVRAQASQPQRVKP